MSRNRKQNSEGSLGEKRALPMGTPGSEATRQLPPACDLGQVNQTNCIPVPVLPLSDPSLSFFKPHRKNRVFNTFLVEFV